MRDNSSWNTHGEPQLKMYSACHRGSREIALSSCHLFYKNEVSYFKLQMQMGGVRIFSLWRNIWTAASTLTAILDVLISGHGGRSNMPHKSFSRTDTFILKVLSLLSMSHWELKTKLMQNKHFLNSFLHCGVFLLSLSSKQALKISGDKF